MLVTAKLSNDSYGRYAERPILISGVHLGVAKDLESGRRIVIMRCRDEFGKTCCTLALTEKAVDAIHDGLEEAKEHLQ